MVEKHCWESPAGDITYCHPQESWKYAARKDEGWKRLDNAPKSKPKKAKKGGK